MLTALDTQRLNECHPDLRRVVEKLSAFFELRVVCGHRSKIDQDAAVAAGKSKTPWPQSKHNAFPSLAVDIVPMEGAKIDWSDRERMTYLAGHLVAFGTMLGVKLRWGGDWDGDGHLKDNNFDDLPHFEMVKE